MGQGQHYNQAAYIGKFYGKINSESKKFREANIELIKIKDIIDLRNSNQVISQEVIESKIISKPAFKIFSGSYLDKKIEEENDINTLEDKFMHKSNEFTFPYLFSKKNDEIFKLTMNYFSLHEARNYDHYNFLNRNIKNWLRNNESLNDFMSKTPCINEYNTRPQEKTIKCILNKIKKTNNELQVDKSIKHLFNYLYPLVWKKKYHRFLRYSWLVLDIKMGIGTGLNLVLDVNKPMYIQHRGLMTYNHFSKIFREILKDSVIIFLENKKIAFGFLPGFSVEMVSQELLLNYDSLYVFLVELCLYNSYKYIIFTDEKQKDFILKAIIIDFEKMVDVLEKNQKIFL